MVKIITSEKEFENLVQTAKDEDQIIIVDFTATWCGPCSRIAPVFQKLSETYTSVIFVQVDVDDTPEISQKFKVQAMPTFCCIKEGNCIETITGANEKLLTDLLKKYVNN